MLASADRASPAGRSAPPRVALFVTCLVDLMRPSVGFAAVKLLEDAGYRVSVPQAQTCCGQPAYNSGDRADAKAIARRVIAAFEGFDYVVVPSGSCAGMLKVHYPRLFAGDSELGPRAAALARRTFELTSFLADVAGVGRLDGGFSGLVTYHDSCSGLRELGVKEQPRRLLGLLPGVRLKEGGEAETCCGFGGLFCVKYADISERIVDRKVDDVIASGADTLLAGDLGCLLNIAGRLRRRLGERCPIGVRHVAEALAGTAGEPAIGCARGAR
jgi:L-lactate dehydrogenase complex protein LldE